MVGFQISLNAIVEPCKSKLANWAQSRTRDFQIVSSGLQTTFVGIFREPTDQRKFTVTIARNMNNWGIEHIKYKKGWITPLSVSCYLSKYGGSARLQVAASDVVRKIVVKAVENMRAHECTVAATLLKANAKGRLRKFKIDRALRRVRRTILKDIFGVFAHDVKRLKEKKELNKEFISSSPTAQERDRALIEQSQREMAFGN